ncbi:acid phosphatase/Vanadium-dependent haloperoxidase, partial [Rhizoclosmatium globosum]
RPTSFDVEDPEDIELSAELSQHSSRVNHIRWFLQPIFYKDYLALVLLAAAALASELAPPFERTIDAAVLADVDLRYPNRPNIVPMWAVFIVAFLGPLLIMPIIFHLTTPSSSRKQTLILRKTHRFFLALCTTLGLTITTTNLIKNIVGRFRPDFLDRCQYDTIKRKSFPSGHSSFSFGGLLLLSLWGCRVLGAWELGGSSGKRGNSYRLLGRDVELAANSLGSGNNSPSLVPESLVHVKGKRSGKGMAGWLAVLVVGFLPVWAATYIALSRVQQFVHHPTDVLAGSVIGILWRA